MASDDPTALILSPDLAGHREVYCRVLARELHGLGFRIVIAGRLSRAGTRMAVPHVWRARADYGAAVVDLDERVSYRDGDLRSLCRLARDVSADLTLVAEADDWLPALARRALPGSPRLSGRLVGIFIRSTNYAHQMPAEPEGRGARHAVHRALAWRSDARRFHESLIPDHGVLDAALCLDERFVAAHPRSHLWLPDIFRVPTTGGEAGDEALEWGRRLDAFLAQAGPGPVVSYVGWADPRRGYDALLRLAHDTDGCFVHCGESPQAGDGFAAGTDAVRAALSSRARLLETCAYYTDWETAATFLRASRCVALPYSGHLGSSGAMLLALAADRPVVVPDQGLMAWRTRSFGLGEVYPPGDAEGLQERFTAAVGRGWQPYVEALRAYMCFFARKQLTAAVRAAVGDGPGARLPEGLSRMLSPGSPQ